MFKESFVFIFNLQSLENIYLKLCYLNDTCYAPNTILILSEDFSVHIGTKSELLKPFPM